MTDVFAPKPFLDIVGGMVEQVRGSTDSLTDFNVGSVTRSLMEAHAVELDAYYQAVYLGLLEAIPTAIYTGFGFDRRAASAASGVVTFVRDAADEELVIGAGTRLISLGGVSFTLAADVTLAAGVLDAQGIATAVNVGVIGNIAPGTLLFEQTPIGGMSVSNLLAFGGGQDVETNEQRIERFGAFILALARGTISAIEYAATLPEITNDDGVIIERVQRAALYETPGHVDLFVWNGSYGASQELIALAQDLVDGVRDEESTQWVGGYRPAGMRVDVQALGETTVDVSLEAKSMGAHDAVEAAINVALDHFLITRAAGAWVRSIDLTNAALSADGVLSVTLLSPLDALVVPHSSLLRLGSLAITWTE